MLILRRKEGQWVEITHKSGDTLRVRVYNIRSRYPGQLDLAFDDPARNFVIQRPERGTRQGGGCDADDRAGVGGHGRDHDAVVLVVDAADLATFAGATSASPSA